MRRIVTEDIAGFMVKVVEVISWIYYKKDRAKTFQEFKERGILDVYIRDFEQKRAMSDAEIIEEMKNLLGFDEIPAHFPHALLDADTESIQAIAKAIVREFNWNYSVALDRFYRSQICGVLSDSKLGFSSIPTEEVLEMFVPQAKAEGWLSDRKMSAI